MDTGWSLSSGRPKAGPVGRCDRTVLSPATSFIEPDCRQILVEEMARTDLPAFDIGAVGHDPVPPESHDFMRLVVERMLLVLTHQQALLRRIGLVQHPLIEIDRRRVVEIPILLGEHRARLVLLTSSTGLITLWQFPSMATSKLPLRRPSNHGPVGNTRCVTFTPILLHSSTSQMPRYLKRLVDTAVQQFETQPLGPCLL